MTIRVRNAQVYETASGGWRYRARGGNWKTVGVSEEEFKNKNYALKRLIETYPQTETIDIIRGEDSERIDQFSTGVWPFRKVLWTAN
jgi:hypothetical protein